MPTVEANRRIKTLVFGGPANTTGVLAAVTDTGAQQVINHGFRGPAFPSRITATAGGTGGDIKAIQVVVDGTAPGGEVIQETLPAFTVNTPGSVTGSKVFATVTQVTIPAHDGTGATTAIGQTGAPDGALAAGVLAAVTDTGVEQVITTGFNQPDVPRNITATSGGTANDIGAVQVVVEGLNAEGVEITETLPIFTANSGTTEVGAKAFAKVTQVTLPAHDGTGATTAIGFGDVLGIGERLARNTVKAAYLAEVVEGTAPTVVVDADDIESNTFEPDTNPNETQIKLELVKTSN